MTVLAAGLAAAAAFLGAFLICLVFFSAFLAAGFLAALTVSLPFEADFSLFTAGLVYSTLTDSTGADFGVAGLAFSDDFAFYFYS